jgi:hypothetical protein
MRKRGIDLILGDYVDIAETTEVSGISTRSGKAIKSADLVVCPIPVCTSFACSSIRFIGPDSWS